MSDRRICVFPRATCHTLLRTFGFISLTLLLCITTPATARSPVPNEDGALFMLTREERAYLAEKQYLTMVCDPAWPPFDYIDGSGHHAGMAADYLSLFSNRIGIPIKLIPTKTWSESVDIAKAGECDLASLLNKTPERDKYLDFTAPYFHSNVVIIGRDRFGFQKELGDFKGKSLAVAKGYWVEEAIRRDHPDTQLVTDETTLDALRMVARGQAYAAVATEIEAIHLIRSYPDLDLHVIGETPYTNDLRLGVRKNAPMLLAIMNKVVNSVTYTERRLISAKWIAEEALDTPDYSDAFNLLVFLGIFLSVVFFLTRRLR